MSDASKTSWQKEKKKLIYNETITCCNIVLLSFVLFGFVFVFVCLLLFGNCFSRDVHQPLSQIRLSLSALGDGQFIFLVGINATENKVSDILIHL